MLKKFCRKQGCSELVSEGYCEDHKAESYLRYDRYRNTAAERGYDHKWRKARVRHLKQNPLCVECERKGLIKQATDVDHIIPHRGDKNLFWDKSNWQSLCKSCHSRKTMRGE